MVSLENSFSDSTRFPLSRNFSSSSARIHRHVGRSMRTVRSNLYKSDNSCSSFPDHLSEKTESRFVSENLTDSVVEMRLGELAARYSKSSGGGKSVKSTSSAEEDFLEMSRAFSDFSACSSDISGELQRLACLPSSDDVEVEENSDPNAEPEPEPEPCHGFLQRESFSTEIMESISPEDLQPTVKLCIDGLQSASVAVKRSAAAKIRLLAKDRCENRALIGDSGAIPALVPLLRCSDPATQENAVTALLNLSLYGENKQLITGAGAIKSLIYALRTGTEISKQNAACALLSLAMIEENKSSIGACGAIPPLVSLLLNGSSRGKKDALTTLYKLCSVKVNKERAVNAGAVRPLVDMVAEQGNEMAEKAMVVLNSLAGIVEGREAIVEEDGIPALVEAIEDGSMKGKEFAVLALLQLCAENVKNRGLLVREGGIPPLVALSETGNLKTKRKAEKLLGYLRESRNGASSSTP